ncbi:glycosyltransferase [Actinocrispum sp. NPDC049592]|uniref:glycosyltransferase n=1 Tax=Actinocrispum sp. NPDC049592 TaxID=3154835 RepID=UPI0034244E6F
MRIVFTSLPAYGHLYPMLPLALACADAGHEVTVATGEPFAGRLPLPTARTFDADKLNDLQHQTARSRRGPMDPAGFATAFFGEFCAPAAIEALQPIFTENRPDLVVYAVADVGAAVVAHAMGVAAVAFGLGQWHPVLAEWQATASRLNNSAAQLRHYLDPAPSVLSTNPAGIPIRPVAWSEDGPTPEWRLSRPRVYITLGTVAFGAVEVLRRAILETAAHDVEILVAVGPSGDPALLGDLPDNVTVERFVSQAAVLPEVDLVVHHGGSGTMLGAMEHGLPQLILPQGADQFINAETVARIQAGRALRNDEQVPGAIQAAVEQLLTDGPERLTAKRIAGEIAAMPAPAEVVPVLEGLVR